MVTDEVMRMKPLSGKERLVRDAEYLGAFDIEPGTEPVLTIKAIYCGDVTLGQGRRERKNLLVFEEESVPGIGVVRPMILNTSNWKTLRKVYGDTTAEVLVGKKIQLYIVHNVRNPGSGDKVDGIRIREKAPAAVAYAPPVCEVCGKPITAVGGYTPEQVAELNLKRYKKKLCGECSRKMKEAQEAAEKAAKAAVEAPVQTVNTLLDGIE